MMRALEAKEIQGCWATCLLSITEDDAIDYAFIDEEIALFHQAGVSGVYSNGTAGEFYTQSRAEFEKINTLLARGCESRALPFQIGASHPFPHESLELIRIARDLAPSAIQVILPDWFPVKRDEMVSYLEVAAKTAGPIKLVLYNPPHAKVVLTPADFLFLSERVEGLAGIKTAGGDEAWYLAMQPVFSRLSVFIPGHTYASGIAKGAHGAYSNMACLNPKAAQQWALLAQTDMDAALELEGRIMTFMKGAIIPFITEQGYSNQACDKLLAAVGGWGSITSRIRWPYAWVPHKEVAGLRSYGKTVIPEFF